MKAIDPPKEEAAAVPSEDPKSSSQDESPGAKDDEERTPSPSLKVEANESEMLKELKAKLK